MLRKINDYNFGDKPWMCKKSNGEDREIFAMCCLEIT